MKRITGLDFTQLTLAVVQPRQHEAQLRREATSAAASGNTIF
jgi:hypothetical protein